MVIYKGVTMAESTPGDYYERQKVKAEELQARLNETQTKLDNQNCTDFYCSTCSDLRTIIRGLKVQLATARYTGD